MTDEKTTPKTLGGMIRGVERALLLIAMAMSSIGIRGASTAVDVAHTANTTAAKVVDAGAGFEVDVEAGLRDLFLQVCAIRSTVGMPPLKGCRVANAGHAVAPEVMRHGLRGWAPVVNAAGALPVGLMLSLIPGQAQPPVEDQFTLDAVELEPGVLLLDDGSVLIMPEAEYVFEELLMDEDDEPVPMEPSAVSAPFIPPEKGYEVDDADAPRWLRSRKMRVLQEENEQVQQREEE